MRALAGVLSILFAAAAAQAATITYFGTDTDLGGGWRTSTVTKQDIDGNNVLGSDGWYLFGDNTSHLDPSYFTGISVPAAINQFSNGSYYHIDDPLTTPGGSPTTIYSGVGSPVVYESPFPPPSAWETSYAFTLTGNVPPTIRIGIMVDNGTAALYDAGSVQVIQTNGGAAGAEQGVLFGGSSNLVPDWIYYDIQGSAGDSFAIQARPGFYGLAAVGAVSFDSTAVPEPSAFLFIGSAIPCLIAFRRRRK